MAISKPGCASSIYILVYILRKKAAIRDPMLYSSFPSLFLYGFCFAWERNGKHFSWLFRFTHIFWRFKFKLKCLLARETNFLIASVSLSKLHCKSEIKWTPSANFTKRSRQFSHRFAYYFHFRFLYFCFAPFLFWLRFGIILYLYDQIDWKTCFSICSILSVSFDSNYTQMASNSKRLDSVLNCSSKLSSVAVHCKKELAIFPSPAGMSPTKLSLAGKKLNYSRPGRVWSVTSRLRTGKRLTLFYSVPN